MLSRLQLHVHGVSRVHSGEGRMGAEETIDQKRRKTLNCVHKVRDSASNWFEQAAQDHLDPSRKRKSSGAKTAAGQARL